MKTSFLGAAGNRLAADVSGPEEAPVVLLLHGGGQTRHSWSRAHRELANHGYRAISVDARGHGESDWSADGDYSVEAQVADLLSLIDAVGGRPALVGASMGGTHSLLACGLHPDIASALVLVDVTPRLETRGIEHIVSFMKRHMDGFDTLQHAAEAVAAYNPNRRMVDNNAGLAKNLRKREDDRWYWHWDPRFMDGDHQAKVAHISQRMEELAAHVEIPTLLVRGKQSDVVGLEGVRELRALLPHLEFIDIEGAGHMVAGDRNDRFNSAILEFLQRTLPLSD